MLNDLLTPEKALIFRIVHMENVAHVLKSGCLCRSGTAGDYTEIGNHDLISKRMTRTVPCVPGGTLSDYVPFYFTPCSPMMMNIKTGWNGVKKLPLKDLVILVSSLYHLQDEQIPFLFTDRHAYLKTALYSNDLADLGRIIWPSLQARDFRRDDTDKIDRYQAEALVYRHVPLTALLGLACHNEGVKDAVAAEAARCKAEIKVVVRKDWYL